MLNRFFLTRLFTFVADDLIAKRLPRTLAFRHFVYHSDRLAALSRQRFRETDVGRRVDATLVDAWRALQQHARDADAAQAPPPPPPPGAGRGGGGNSSSSSRRR